MAQTSEVVGSQLAVMPPVDEDELELLEELEELELLEELDELELEELLELDELITITPEELLELEELDEVEAPELEELLELDELLEGLATPELDELELDELVELVGGLSSLSLQAVMISARQPTVSRRVQGLDESPRSIGCPLWHDVVA